MKIKKVTGNQLFTLQFDLVYFYIFINISD